MKDIKRNNNNPKDIVPMKDFKIVSLDEYKEWVGEGWNDSLSVNYEASSRVAHNNLFILLKSKTPNVDYPTWDETSQFWLKQFLFEWIQFHLTVGPTSYSDITVSTSQDTNSLTSTIGNAVASSTIMKTNAMLNNLPEYIYSCTTSRTSARRTALEQRNDVFSMDEMHEMGEQINEDARYLKGVFQQPEHQSIISSDQTLNIGYTRELSYNTIKVDLKVNPNKLPSNVVLTDNEQTITGNKTIQLNTSASTFTISDNLATLFLARQGQIDIYKNLYLSGKATITRIPTDDEDIPNKKYVDEHSGGGTPPDTITIRITDNKLEAFALKRTSDILDANSIADLTSQQTITGNKDFTGGNNRFVLTDANKFLRIGHDVQGEEITFNDHQVNFPSIWTVKFQGIVEALDPTTPQQVATLNYLNNNYPKKTDFDNLTIVNSSSFGNKWTAMANVKVFGNDDPNTVPRGYCITGGVNIPFGWSTVGSSVLGFGHVKHSGGSIQIALGFSNVNNGLMATRSTVNTSNFTAWDTISTPFRHRERFVLATGQILATVSTAFSIASTIKQGRYATALLSNQYVVPPIAVVGDLLSIKFDLQMTINSGVNPNIEFVLWNATTGAQLGNTRIFQYSNQAGNTTFDFATIPFAINTSTLKVGDHLEVRYRLTNTSTAYSILPNSYILWEIERAI